MFQSLSTLERLPCLSSHNQLRSDFHVSVIINLGATSVCVLSRSMFEQLLILWSHRSTMEWHGMLSLSTLARLHFFVVVKSQINFGARGKTVSARVKTLEKLNKPQIANMYIRQSSYNYWNEKEKTKYTQPSIRSLCFQVRYFVDNDRGLKTNIVWLQGKVTRRHIVINHIINPFTAGVGGGEIFALNGKHNLQWKQTVLEVHFEHSVFW